MSATHRPTATGAARQPAPVLSARCRQRASRWHGRPGADRAAAARRAALSPDRLHVPADLRAGLRDHQGRHQLLRRHLVGPIRPQARVGGRLAARHPRSPASDLGAVVGLGRGGQRAARRQSGTDLVDHRGDEDRPRRSPPARPGHGFQRGGRLRRRRADRRARRLPRRPLRPAARAVPARPVVCADRTGPVRACSCSETRGHAHLEASQHGDVDGHVGPIQPRDLQPHQLHRARIVVGRARRAWSTTSTSGCRGGCSRSCSPPPECPSNASASWSRSTPPCGGWRRSSLAHCRIGGAASISSPPGCSPRPPRWH